MTTETKPPTTALAPVAQRSAPFLPIGGLQIDSFDSLQRFAKAMAETGHYGGDARRAAAEIMLRVQYGAELGIPPMAAVANVSIINGVPSLGAHLIRHRCQTAGYEMTVTEHDDTACTITVSHEGKLVGACRYTVDDAKRAELFGKKSRNWERHPRNMVYARAVSNAARFYCVGAFFGSVYSAEEMRDENGVSYDGVEVFERPEPAVERRVDDARDITPHSRVFDAPSRIDDAEGGTAAEAEARDVGLVHDGLADIAQESIAAYASLAEKRAFVDAAVSAARASATEEEIVTAWHKQQRLAPEALRDLNDAIFDATLSRFLGRSVSPETMSILDDARAQGLLPAKAPAPT